MDRAYHEAVGKLEPGARLERPIVPLYEVGQTVPETDPSGRFKTLVQNVQAQIRGGAGKLQLVFTVPHTSALGGRPHAHGNEEREILRSIMRENDVELTGVEMPTSLNNMSGLDLERGKLSEETRKKHMDEVRNAMRFLADTGGGGGIDIVSFEFPRTFSGASWNKDKEGNPMFKTSAGKEEKPELWLVDKRSGGLTRLPELPLDFKPGTFDPKTGLPEPLVKEKGKEQPEPEIWRADDIIKLMEKSNAAKRDGYKDALKLFQEGYLKNQRDVAEAEASRHLQRKEDQEEILEKIPEALKAVEAKRKSEEMGEEEYKKEIAKLQKKEADLKKSIKIEEDAFRAQQRTRKEHEEGIKQFDWLDVEAKRKSIESYADLGISAWAETHNRNDLRNPIHVGPEIGWPDRFGGHPDEWLEIINESRKQMAERLLKEGPKLLGRSFTPEQAQEEAKIHIKGTLDTSHMAMWLQHFQADNPNYDKRKNKFYDEVYKDWVDKIVKQPDVVGTIQIVDSRHGEHGHLPPGQGEIPIKDVVEKLKKNGWAGAIISEGHSEETLGEGRIRTEAWRYLGTPLQEYYQAGGAVPFGQAQHGYFGRTYSPKQMFGSYSPPFGEYKPWAGGDNPIPFE